MMAKKTSKLLAMLLAVVMMMGLLNIAAFAEGTDAKPVSQDQVMSGYFTGEDLSKTTDEATATGGDFTLSKTIEQIGKDQFDVTLTVRTQQTITEVRTTLGTVLVIDLSNSMDNQKIGTRTRLAVAKEKAAEFLAAYAGEDENAVRELCIVTFGTGAKRVMDWKNVAGGAGKNHYNEAAAAISGLQASGGTNLEAGLRLAYNNLSGTDADVKNVVLLTDGVPTYRMKESSDSAISISNNHSGSGSNGSEANNNAAKKAADDIKGAPATLYTICLGAQNDECYKGAEVHVCANCGETRDQHNRVTVCANCGQSRDQHEWDWMWGFFGPYRALICSNGRTEYDGQNVYYCKDNSGKVYDDTVKSGSVTVGYFLSNDVASANCFYGADDSDKLGEVFASIVDSIEESGSTGAGSYVTDPMGAYIVLGDIQNLDASVAGNTIIWELDVKDADVSETADGAKVYTYSITYPITLDTAADGFESGKYYPTNGRTYLTVGEETYDFNVPGVKGEAPLPVTGTLGIMKVMGEKNEYAPATFVPSYTIEITSQVKGTAGQTYETSEDGVTVTFDENNVAEVELSADEFISVLGLPEGQYTVNEVSADVDGYTLSTEYSVRGGVATVRAAADTPVTVTNTYTAIPEPEPEIPTGTLTIEKVMGEDNEYTADGGYTFTVTSQMDATAGKTYMTSKTGTVVTFNENNVAEVKLSAGESVTIADLPVGQYTVTEVGATVDGYTLETEYSVEGGIVTVASAPAAFSNVVVTNNCNKQNYNVGKVNLIVAKLTQNAGYVVFTDVELTADQKAQVIDLINSVNGFNNATANNTAFEVDANFNFRNGEITYDGADVLHFDDPSQWAKFFVCAMNFDAPVTGVITVTNTYTAIPEPLPETANIQGVKVVEQAGNVAAPDKTFTFVLKEIVPEEIIPEEIIPEAEEPVMRAVAVEEEVVPYTAEVEVATTGAGSYDFYFENVPVGTYTVTEKDASGNDWNCDATVYTVEVSENGVSIYTDDNEFEVVKFTNTYTKRETPVDPPVIPPVTVNYTLTVKYVDEAGNEVAATETKTLSSGVSYTTAPKTVDGYEFKEVAATSDAANGYMNGNKTVVYVYTAVEEIVEPPVPVAPGPEVIEEPEVPAADVPETGDNTGLWIALVVLSGIAMVGMTVLPKRKENA